MPAKPLTGFVHINKTGGTTIKFILRNSTWFRHCDLQTLRHNAVADKRDIDFAQKIFFFGFNSIAGHSLQPWVKDLPQEITYFTILRDPLERCLSNYQHVKRARRRSGRDITFEEFMHDESYTNLQVRNIAGVLDLEKAKELLKNKFFFVGLLERFDESMRILQKLFPYPLRLQYQPQHVTRDNTAKQKVLDSAASRDLLRQGNQLDLELYAFVRDELYPAFRKKADIPENALQEKAVQNSSYPIRYKVTRCYNQAIYRTLHKMRRLIAGAASK
jgi:Sulfotransferase family